jgi:magnesium-transporting ATPase (P-type)
LDETLPTPTDALLIMFLGLIMVIGTASVFYFAGGGIISDDPCSTGPAGGEDFMVNGVCNEDAWFANAEDQFAIARTSAFGAFIFFQLLNVMNCRSSEISAFRLGLTSNSWITVSILISTSMLLLFVHAPEIYGFRIGEMIHTVPLKPLDWLVVFTVASSVFVAEEMRKMLWPKSKN